MKYRLIQKRDKNLTGLEQVLHNRGLNKDDIQHYLNVDTNDLINPSTIARMKEGAELFLKHFNNKDDIMIQVDSDCDGFTSSAILVNYLYLLDPEYTKTKVHYYFHEVKGHGILLQHVTEDIKLVVVPDAGSEEYEKHKILQDKGIDVLVIDHHPAPKVSEYACVINNQLCDYPTKALSGAGMVLKFCTYLDSLNNTNYAENFYDLAALGIIADLMPLDNFEVREIIEKGVNNIHNPFIHLLVVKNTFYLYNGSEVTPKFFGFSVAPYVNAIARIGTLEERQLLFESMLDYMAYEEIPSTKRGSKPGDVETRVTQAVRTATNVKNRQDRPKVKVADELATEIEQYQLEQNKIIIIKIPEEKADMTIKSITGLIANQIMGKYHRPVLFLHEETGEDGITYWRGSGRNPELDDLPCFKTFVKDSNLAEFASGHESAFGTLFTDENLTKFINYANDKLKDMEYESSYQVDIIWDTINIDGNDILSIAYGTPLWGKGLEEPLVAIENVNITPNNIHFLKNSTVKIDLPHGISMIQFKVSEDHIEELTPPKDGMITATFIGTCSCNSGGGNAPQIIIKDFEVTRKMDYCF